MTSPPGPQLIAYVVRKTGIPEDICCKVLKFGAPHSGQHKDRRINGRNDERTNNGQSIAFPPVFFCLQRRHL